MVAGFYYIRFLNKKNAPVTYEISPFHDWNIEELNNESILVPWNEIFKSRLATMKELKSIGLHNNEDFTVVYYRSPQHYWDNLAGTEGYVLISKKEKKQIDFITTIVS